MIMIAVAAVITVAIGDLRAAAGSRDFSSHDTKSRVSSPPCLCTHVYIYIYIYI